MTKKNQLKRYHSKKKNAPNKKYKKRKKQLKKNHRNKQFFFEVTLALFLILVMIYGQSFFFFSLVKVDSYAMTPRLSPGEYALVEKNSRIQRQDIVLIKRENMGRTEIRRVIGLPEETIEYKNDQLLINGIERTEPYLAKEKQEANDNDYSYTKNFNLYELIGERQLPADAYFVMGDNRLFSTDSREYGVVKKTEIIGVVSTLF